MIDSVIFDCDGTLLDSMPAWHALQERFAQKAGIALNSMQLVRLNANTLPETAAFFHRECGLGSSVEEVLDDAHQILLSEYRDNVLARSGAVELARRLSGDGVKLAVASSSPVDFLQAGFMTLGIYDSDNAGTKEDLREAADSFINGFEELDYECFVRGWKRESVVIR